MSLRTRTVAADPPAPARARRRGRLARCAGGRGVAVHAARRHRRARAAARPARHGLARARPAPAAADRHERRSHPLAGARADQRADVQLPLHAAVLLVPHRVVGEHRRVPDLHADRGRARQLRRRLPLGQRRRQAARAQHGAAAGAGDRPDPLRRPAAGVAPHAVRLQQGASACAAPLCASPSATESWTSASAAMPRRRHCSSRSWSPSDGAELVTLRGDGGVLVLPISDSGVTFGFLAVDTGPPAGRRRDGRRARVVLQHPRPRARAGAPEHEGVMLQALKETDRLRTRAPAVRLARPAHAADRDHRVGLGAARERARARARRHCSPASSTRPRRLVRLVDNMLDLSRIEAGALQPAPHADARRRAALRAPSTTRRLRSKASSSTSTAPPSCPR